jgi:hypothetical protein
VASFARRRLTRNATVFSCVLGSFLASRSAEADQAKTTVDQGYELGEVQHPRGVAMGGAQTALGMSTAAIWLNPANLPLARVYHLEAIAAGGLEARRQQYGGAIADSSTSRIAGGFGGTWSMQDPDGIHRSWTDLRLTIAYPLADRISFGVTARYLRLGQSVNAGPLGNSLASSGTPGDPIYNGFTWDAGVTIIPVNGLYIAAVGRNLTPDGGAIAPTSVIGGVGYNGGGAWSVEADSNVDFSTYAGPRARYMAGGEYFVAERIPLRLGYRYDDGTRSHAVSFGVGYVDRKWSVELGVRRDVVADHPATLGVIGFRLFYDQSGSDTDGLAEPAM